MAIQLRAEIFTEVGTRITMTSKGFLKHCQFALQDKSVTLPMIGGGGGGQALRMRRQ